MHARSIAAALQETRMKLQSRWLPRSGDLGCPLPMAAIGPLRSLAARVSDLLAVERGKAGGGYAPALECGSPSLREGFPALLDRMARRETRFTPCGRSAQTVSASQMHEARAARAR